jgi:phosphopantothenoylcysteine decarboxylase/phosphopantothenate--cysteine ligase
MTGRLAGRLIGLGVTGSIAAYKAVELLRLLQAEGADVAVMLSPSATQFVGPLSFAALSRHPVETDVLDLLPDGRIGHIVVGDSADAIVVAPATAHFLGAMATGLAGDVVTATCLATRAPVVVAPAMDGDMWTHPATTRNVARLREDGDTIVGWPSSPGSWTPWWRPSAIARSVPRTRPPGPRSWARPATPISPAATWW